MQFSVLYIVQISGKMAFLFVIIFISSFIVFILFLEPSVCEKIDMKIVKNMVVLLLGYINS